jgi:hypothetical protein
VNDLRLADNLADLVRQRAREVHLQLERREAPARRHQRVDAAAERRVEERRGEAAVRDAWCRL